MNATATTTKEPGAGTAGHRENTARALDRARSNARVIGRRFSVERVENGPLPHEVRFERGSGSAHWALGTRHLALGGPMHPIVEKILAELPAWCHRGMAAPHVMRLVAEAERKGLGGLKFEAAGRGGVLVGIDADGREQCQALDLHALHGVVMADSGMCLCCGSVLPSIPRAEGHQRNESLRASSGGDVATPLAGEQPVPPFEYTGAIVAPDFAGISVPADAKSGRGGGA